MVLVLPWGINSLRPGAMAALPAHFSVGVSMALLENSTFGIFLATSVLTAFLCQLWEVGDFLVGGALSGSGDCDFALL